MNLCNIKDVKALLARHGFTFSKRLGQNFLVAADVPERIAEFSGINKEYGVLEVGPGIGALTVHLSDCAGKVLAVEVDEKLMPVLGETLAGRENCQVINVDILNIDIKNLMQKNMPGMKYAACANLPYYITTPVLTRLIKAELFDYITVMVQREVAQRICAVHNTPEYGAFTLFVKYYADAELIFEVPPDSFMPQPKVHSAVVRLRTREKPPENIKNPDAFFALVKCAFGQRRKTLVNAIHNVFGHNIAMIMKTKSGSELVRIKGVEKEEIEGIIIKCGFDTKIRGEALSFDDFAMLSNEMQEFLT